MKFYAVLIKRILNRLSVLSILIPDKVGKDIGFLINEKETNKCVVPHIQEVNTEADHPYRPDMQPVPMHNKYGPKSKSC
ncbi:hypothetical protein RCO48_27160 [Peribacillus frigoritolerans]|nr:hypothetical protein [Peribacillus frigoritolerans]